MLSSRFFTAFCGTQSIDMRSQGAAKQALLAGAGARAWHFWFRFVMGGANGRAWGASSGAGEGAEDSRPLGAHFSGLDGWAGRSVVPGA